MVVGQAPPYVYDGNAVARRQWVICVLQLPGTSRSVEYKETPGLQVRSWTRGGRGTEYGNLHRS